LSDEQGLSIAYDSPLGVYKKGETLYIAGTRTHSLKSANPLHEWIQDLLIPIGLTKHLDRYADAERSSEGVSRFVGHSMGGSVAIELSRLHRGSTVTTYGAPVVSFAKGDRHRDLFDPVSMFDLGATVDSLSTVHSITLGRGRYG